MEFLSIFSYLIGIIAFLYFIIKYNFYNDNLLKEKMTKSTSNEIIEVPVSDYNYIEPDSEIKIDKIFDTEASIVDELSSKVGKITKLSGQIANSEIKLFLTLAGWENISIDFLPTLSIQIEVKRNLNYLIVTSSEKTMSPLKKGDLFNIFFDDGSFIQKKIEMGRIQNGKNVKNFIFLYDLELLSLSQKSVKFIETFSISKSSYGFTEVPNLQYSNSSEGKKLFQIMTERIIAVKSALIN